MDSAADAPADAATDSAAPVECPGGAGCPCGQNSECGSGYCIDDASQAGGKSCGQPCSDTCPGGYTCAQVGGISSDINYLCVNASGRLCEPCVKSADCSAPGLPGAVCVDQGSAGRYCGLACKLDSQCPGGYVCGSVQSAEGTAASQCVKKASSGEAFGSCSCDAFASASQAATTCFAAVKNGQGQVIGKCAGTRACGAAGLGACTALPPQPEICDGADNNCDGVTDEGSCDDGNPCTEDSCDGKGGCGHKALDGASCDADGNVCTQNDACVGAKCTPGKAKNCDDLNACTQDACLPSSGCTQTADDGAPCSDGNPCTIGDTCKGAGCTPGTPKACAGGDACTLAKCNLGDGTCTYANAGNGTPCDDSLNCTQDDACGAGLCVGLPVACTDGNACTLDACDPKSGCTFKALGAGLCSDGSACTSGDACVLGACIGQAVVCDDNNACTLDQCDPLSGCVHAFLSGACEDGDPCTSGDVCSSGVCSSGANICPCKVDSDCPEDGDVCNGVLFCDTASLPYGCKLKAGSVVACSANACNTATCDAKTGACGLAPVVDGAACDADGSLCSQNDACQAGVCTAGSGVNCGDGNACSADSCDAVKGCVNTALSATACDADGDLCTQNDSCKAGTCIPGKPLICDDNDLCTADACLAGSCAFTAIDGLGSACYGGPTGTQGVGICHGGLTSCAAASGIVCSGQQWPKAAEACNGLDDTCNGVTDEGCSASAVALTFGVTRWSAAGSTSLTLRAGLAVPPGSLSADIGYTLFRWGWLEWLLP